MERRRRFEALASLFLCVCCCVRCATHQAEEIWLDENRKSEHKKRTWSETDWSSCLISFFFPPSYTISQPLKRDFWTWLIRSSSTCAPRRSVFNCVDNENWFRFSGSFQNIYLNCEHLTRLLVIQSERRVYLEFISTCEHKYFTSYSSLDCSTSLCLAAVESVEELSIKSQQRITKMCQLFAEMPRNFLIFLSIWSSRGIALKNTFEVCKKSRDSIVSRLQTQTANFYFPERQFSISRAINFF